MTTEPPSSGDAIPGSYQIIEVRVAELRQLLNAIDPSPFHERDLDPRAEEFIVGWSRELPIDAPLALVVHLDRAAGRADEAVIFRDAVHEFFSQRALATRRSLRQLFSRGRTSLAIGLAFLGVSIAIGDGLASYLSGSRFAEIVREGLLIGGWVAMWRPLEVFLYDWWPIRADARLFDRLSAMPVRIEYKAEVSSDAWRSDWPAVPARGEPTSTARDPRHPRPGDPAGTRTIMTDQDMFDRHQHTPEQERRIREAALDQTIEGSFPASDPPSSNPNPDDHGALEPEARRDDE